MKVVRSYQDISNNGSWSVEKRKPNDMRGLALAFEIEALSTSPADNVLVPRHLLIEALVIGEAAVNDDYRRPCGQIPFDAAHKFKMAAFRKIRAMIAQGEK